MTDNKDKKTNRLFTYISACALLVSYQVSAQQHVPHQPDTKHLSHAQELFAQEQYAGAASAAKLYLQQHQEPTNKTQHNAADKAKYIYSTSQLKRNVLAADEFAIKYINTTTSSTHRQRSSYALAQYYFNSNMFEEATPYYEVAGVANLTNDEVIQSKFELAYCYFSSGRIDESELLLASVIELGGKYYDAGNYYYGLLAYNKGDYKKALTSFKRIDDKQEYINIVPYYIAEIYYFSGDNDRALQQAIKLINRKEKTFYDNELHLLAGQIYFEQQEYRKALPYFEHYYDRTERIRKEDLYEMAYCYYKINDAKNAIEYFKQLSDTKDSLGQSSMYMLGDCYLKTGDKKSAKNAFSICADMPYIPSQQEAALLLAAQLSYELGYNSDAIYYTNILLADYPNSQKGDEARTLLAELLTRTKNYAEAYAALEDVAYKGANYNRALQKVSYGYAMLQLQSGNSSFADSLLSMSLAHDIDPTYTSAASFWKADASYKTGNYKQAMFYGNKFINTRMGKYNVTHLAPAATDRNMYITLGYAAMELAEFEKAQEYFSNARYNTDETDELLVAATTLREADAVFMQKKYKDAITLYDKVIAANTSESDYARFQKAVILGLSGSNKKKEQLLYQLINSTPKSNYAVAARYELGLTFIADDKYSTAIKTLTPLTTADDARNIAPKALTKIGFAHQQLNESQKAIATYTQIIEQYPQSEERPTAMEALKSLYIQAGTPNKYAALLKKSNLDGVENSILDSTYYATAETQYAAGNYAQATTLLTDYINKYPNGVFVNKAYYYRGESNYKLKKNTEALADYERVLRNNWSNFSENSARRAAAISYEQNDMQAARGYYAALRTTAMNPSNLQTAYEGLMLTNHKLNNNEIAVAYADTLLTLPELSNDIKNSAQLIKANGLMRSGNSAEALPLYKDLTYAKVESTAAEARYNIAYIHYLQNDYKTAEEAANSTIKQSGGSEYWVVKSYLLLADILTKQEDYFNAKATLQSIEKNCKIEELKAQAGEKLKAVKKLESQKTKLSE